MNALQEFIEGLGRTPIVPLAGFPGARLTGKSTRECLTNAGDQTESLLALYREVRPDALFTMMDLTVEAEFLGCTLKFPEDDPPAVLRGVLDAEGKAEEVFRNKTTGGRMCLFAEVVGNLKQALEIPVCAYVIGPFTLAGQLMDLVRGMKAIRKSPGELHDILSKSTALIMSYIALLEDAGADLICVLEPSAMMISPPHFQEFSGRYCGKIFSEGVSKMSLLHICGDTNHILAMMEEAGADGLSLDKQVNMARAYEAVRDGTVVVGNIDPVAILALGTADSVIEESRKLIASMEGKPNFILSSGCDIPQNAPISNLQAMMSVKGR